MQMHTCIIGSAYFSCPASGRPPPGGSGVSSAGTWRSAGEISAEFCAENSAEICAEILLVVPSVEVEIHMFSRWVDGIVDSALDSGVVG